MKHFVVLGTLAIIIAVVLVTSAPSGNNSEVESVQSPSLSPEQIITFKSGTIACDSEKSYEEMMGHLVRRERSKFLAMFQNFDCIEVLEAEKYKILSLHGGFITRFVEFTHSKSDSANGFWTETSFVKEIVEPAKIDEE